MPDTHGFDHLPRWGVTSHRCIECGWPAEVRAVPEAQRLRHHEQHVREARQRAERTRKDNLARARRMQALAARENALIDERTGGA